jgi:hypothetical protein
MQHTDMQNTPEDTSRDVDEVVRNGGVVEGVDSWCHCVMAAVQYEEITGGRCEQGWVVGRPARETILHDAPQIPAKRTESFSSYAKAKSKPCMCRKMVN